MMAFSGGVLVFQTVPLTQFISLTGVPAAMALAISVGTVTSAVLALHVVQAAARNH